MLCQERATDRFVRLVRDRAPSSRDTKGAAPQFDLLPAVPLLPANRRRARHPADGRQLRHLLCAISLCVSAHAQQPAPPLERLVAADCARLLLNADPIVRGEAALIVAAEGTAPRHDTLVSMAKDRDETARIYGILSLGLLATPGVTHVLREYLDTPQKRAEPGGVAAAFALGLLPAEQSASLVSEVLAGFLRGSSKRQHDALLALLHGLQLRPQSSATAALRRLFDEDLAGDAQTRALLLHLLLPLDPSFDQAALRRLLQRGSTSERLAVLRHCGDDGGQRDLALDDVFADVLADITQHDPDAGVRAAALQAMTARRQPKALELAVEALAATDPRLLTVAARAVLSLGGAQMRVVLEQHVLGTIEPARKAALLTAFAAPPSAALLDQCGELAAAREQPIEVRRAAAFLLARAEPTRAAPLLRDLFREDKDPTARRSIATLLLQAGNPPELARLLPSGDSLRAHPDDWHPLLLAGHPMAERQLLALLEDPRATAAELGPALRAWRCRVATALPANAAAQLPKPLARILANTPSPDLPAARR